MPSSDYPTDQFAARPGDSRPLRVLHVYRTYFPDPPGGLQEAIRQIALGTHDYDVEPRILTLSPDPVPHEIYAPEGLIMRERSWAAPASCDLGGPASLRRYREQAGGWADLVHFHFPWPFGDVLRLLGGRSIPAVMTYHSDVVRQRWLGKVYEPVMRRMLRTMDAVVATSPTYARTSSVLTRYVPADRLRAIPLGIADYAATGAQGDLSRLVLTGRPMFLSLGVLRYYKGLHTLIEAAPGIDADFVIAGSGPEMVPLRQLAIRHGASNVIFAGQVTDAEKNALLRACRALVLPSQLRSEAFGMVLVEAAMFGKPMVCCEIGSGTSYVNQDGKTGFVVSPESPAALAQAVDRLRADPALAARMGEAARRRYDALFSGPALGAAYASLYRDVLATRAARAAGPHRADFPRAEVR